MTLLDRLKNDTITVPSGNQVFESDTRHDQETWLDMWHPCDEVQPNVFRVTRRFIRIVPRETK